MAGPHIRLRGIGPLLEGKSWESTKVLRIGRAEDVEIVISDSSISRYHAEVQATDQGWMVRDLESTNGTFVNGARVGQAGRKLRPRDVLQVANLAMVVALAEDGTPSETLAANLQVEASTKQSWEKVMEVLGFGSGERPQGGQPLLALFRTGYHLSRIASLDELLHAILADAVKALEAQRGSVVLADEASGTLKLRAVSTGERDTSSRSHYSSSLAQRCFQNGESVLCRDVHNDPELVRARSISDGAMASILCVLLRSPRKKLGVLHLDRGPIQPAFSRDDLYLADAIAASVSAGIESAQLLEQQRDLFIHTVTALAQAVELRDHYTGGHTQRVCDYALLIADELKLSPGERHHIQIGTPLHDIGKIGIDDAILRKPGPLTPEEFEIMKAHTWRGAAIIETIPELAPVIPIVRNHHEHWDGRGYPDALAGEKIPLLARIISVGDAFDAMTSTRPYRPGMPPEKAFKEVEERQGTHFDPTCAQAFLRRRQQVEEFLRQNPPVLSDKLIVKVIDSEGTVFSPKGPRTEQVKRPKTS